MMEIRFKRDTTFRKQFFVPDSFAHPAKMDAQLLIWILERYTSEGETILDPMAGSGTMMLACGLGRNVILVELEEKFCKMMRDNWEEVKMRPQLGYEMGDCQIIQGDARQLEGVVDKCIFSPPYTNRMDGGMRGPRAGMVPYTNEAPDSWFTQRDQNNIGNLPYGSIDKIVTSPPYALEDRIRRDDTNPRTKDIRESKGIGTGKDFTYGKNNLGNLPYGNIDAVVTSPPYFERHSYPDIERERHAVEKLKAHPDSKIGGVRIHEHCSESPDNIGNLKSSSYLEAMLQVYQQCHSVLKEGGLMILVTKNFIRNKQVIRLDTDTIELCEQAGFTYLERHYRKLPSQSFWRVIYHQKHPEVEKLEYEDVLVFRKIVELKLYVASTTNPPPPWST